MTFIGEDLICDDALVGDALTCPGRFTFAGKGLEYIGHDGAWANGELKYSFAHYSKVEYSGPYCPIFAPIPTEPDDFEF